MEATFVVVGGGIAGVSCAETLAFFQPKEKIILVSESKLIKTVTNIKALTKNLITFDVIEKESSVLENHANIVVIHDKLLEVISANNTLKTVGNLCIKYKYLCLCMGAEPKLISQANNSPYILGIRDTDSVEYFSKKLHQSKRVIIIGNGGIASELVFKIKNVEIVWIIKDKHITATFIDPGAAEFFQSALLNAPDYEQTSVKRMRYEEHSDNAKSGAALGPDWYQNFNLTGNSINTPIKIIYEAEISDVNNTTATDEEFSIEVTLTNGTKIQCDFIISATGVTPRSNFKCDQVFDLSEDGGIKVNEYMKTSIPNIYAAGDICTASWLHAKHWFPMKLWTQARQMGCYSANCMSSELNNEEILQDFCFEMFAHSTKLYGFKVILLGLYNGQKLNNDYEILLRMTKGHEYIKFVMQNNKLQGAILIGNTDLEEMCENLILNQLDLSPFGDDILNPNIDIEDYFD